MMDSTRFARTLFRFRWIETILAIGILFGVAGCSVESRKAERLAKGDAFFAEGKYQHAEIEFLAVLDLDLKETRALRQLGIIAFEQGRLGLAVVYLQRAKELAPTETATRAKLGLAFLSLGNRKEAAVEAVAVLDQNPGDGDAALLLAEAAADEEALAAARSRFLALPASISETAPIQTALGILDLKQRRSDEASRRFALAVEKDPAFAPAHAGLGVIYSGAADYEKAEASFARAAELSPPRSPRRLQYASFKQQRGDIAGARKVLESILAQAEDALTAKIRLAELAAGEGKNEEASQLVTSALTAEPNHPEGLLLSSRLALARNEPEQALTMIGKLLRIYPRSTQALYEQARAYLAQSDVSRAESTFNQVLAIQPDHRQALVALASLYLRQDDRSAAIALLRPWLERQAPDEIPPDLVEAFALLAEALRGHGEFAETLKIYQRIERVAPGREHLSLMRGIVLRQQNKLPEARAAMEEALQRNPSSALAIEQLVALDVAENKIPDARARIDGALKSQPESADLHLLSARLSLAERNRAAADASIQTAIKLQPNRPQGYVLLARIQLDAGEEAAALATLRSVVQRSPRNSTAWLLIGTLEDKHKNYDQARAAYEKLITITPNSAPALNNLAALLSLRFREYDKAYELARRARELAPGDGVVADTLGWIGFLRGEYAWALGLLRESTGKLPDDPEGHYHLAMTLYMLGEERAAESAFEQALSKKGPFASEADARDRLAFLKVDPIASAATQRPLLEQRLAANPKDPVVLSRLAGIKRAENNLNAATDLQRRAVQASPEGARLRVALARLLAAQGQTTPALDQVKIARKLAPDNREIALELGTLAHQLGDYAWSFTVLQDLARRGTPSSEVLRMLAGSAYAIGRVTEAQEALSALLAQGPDPAAQVRLQLIGAAASRETATAAVSTAKLRLATEPKDLAALMVLAVAGGIGAEARSQLETILTLYPDFVPAKRHLVLHLYLDPTQDARTLQLGNQARELLRTDAELNRALGLVVFRSGDFRRALGLLESSTEAYPKEALLWYYVGRCYEETKQPTPAAESLQRALKLGLSGQPGDDAKARLAALGARKSEE